MANKLRKSLEKEWKDINTRSRKGYTMPFPYSPKSGSSLGEHGIAVARAVDVPCKPKHCKEICRYLRKMAGGSAERGWTVENSMDFLERVIRKETPVPFVIHTDGAGHRKGNMASGKYPIKAAKYVLRILRDAESNALNTLSLEEPFLIVNIVATRGRVIQGWRPRAHGRSTPWETHTTNLEVVIKEAGE